MPCLVQTEALFDDDKGLSLQEWASFWKIQRLCLANRHGVLFLMRTWRQSFQMFQMDICFPKHLFFLLTVWQNQFYLDLLDQWGLCLANTNICLKTLYKYVHVWNFIQMSFLKTDPLWLSNRAKQSMSQPCSKGSTVLFPSWSILNRYSYAMQIHVCNLDKTGISWASLLLSFFHLKCEIQFVQAE